MTMSDIELPQRQDSRAARFMQFPLTRIVLAALMVGITVNLSFVLARFIAPDKAMRIMWPSLIAALLCCAAYFLYVRIIEKRAVDEFSITGAWKELGAGVLLGMALLAVVMAILFALNIYQVSGINNWQVLIVPSAEILLVACMEEIIFRAVLFRIIEKSLGTWAGIIISSLIFAIAHLSNDGISVLAVISIVTAGILLAGAYLTTQRLWFPIGLHFAWDYCLSTVFSANVSGHAGHGLLIGNLSGPNWLSGGVFGVEASLITPIVIFIAGGYLISRAKNRKAFLPLNN